MNLYLSKGFSLSVNSTSTCITALGETSPSRPDSILMKKIDNLFPGSMETSFKSQYLKKSSKSSKKDTPKYNAWMAIPKSVARDEDEEVTSVQ